jgi:UDP-galactopyranose mutase
MALPFTRHLKPIVTVYDCMDQLSHFLHAPREIEILERELMARADVVFTGGMSLFEAKRNLHNNIFAFPSSIDVEHFSKGRQSPADPADQACIKGSLRIGYCGVIDERIDIALIESVADRCPDWQLIMIGPVVKIDPATLPKRSNIHYLGGKPYQDLPAYMGNWHVAMMPFARNPATKFISPTKTPEYLSAGRPVVSTSIRDVVRPYGEKNLVQIADDVDAFIKAVDIAVAQSESLVWAQQVDRFLAQTSWDKTFNQMWHHVQEAILDHDGSLPLQQLLQMTAEAPVTQDAVVAAAALGRMPLPMHNARG